MAQRSPFADVADGPAPDAVVVGFRRSGARTILLLGGIGLVFGGGALGYVLDPAHFAHGGHASPLERWIAGVVAVPLLLMALRCLVAMPVLLSTTNGIAVDERGVWRRLRRLVSVLEWRDVAGIGVAALSTSMNSGKNRASVQEVLEIYPSHRLDWQRYPAFDRERMKAPPLREGLPHVRLRIPLPAFDTDAQHRLVAGIQRFAPQLWLGDYRGGTINPVGRRQRPTSPPP